MINFPMDFAGEAAGKLREIAHVSRSGLASIYGKQQGSTAATF
jgi:hypothetical protein